MYNNNRQRRVYFEDDSPLMSDDFFYEHDEAEFATGDSETDCDGEGQASEGLIDSQQSSAIKSKRKRKKSTIIHENSDKPLAEQHRHYVSNKQFLEAMKARRIAVQEALAAGRPKPKISDYIGLCILQIANNLGKKRNFARYGYKEEMISDAVVVCMNYLDNFNPDVSSNPFSYFTQVCNYAFINRITAEKEEQYIKYRSTLDTITSGELATDEDLDNSHLFDNIKLETQYMEDFVEDFERKKQKTDLQKLNEKTGLERFFDDNE